MVDGADVSLRPIARADAAPWFAYISRPGVLEHTSWKLAGIDDLHATIDLCDSDDTSTMRFAIVDRSTGALAGTIGLPVISLAHRTAEIAYDIDPAHAGRGIATACCRAVAGWLLEERNFVRVQATALDTNAGSQRVLAKSGFLREGKLVNLKLVRDEPRDFFLFARTAKYPDDC